VANGGVPGSPLSTGRRHRIRKGRAALALKAFELRDAGRPTAAIARELSVPRSTVRSWFGSVAGVAQWAEAIGLKPIQWGFESPHQHQRQAYSYLLGMYLGDGHIARMPRTFRLRIFLNRRQHDVIARVKQAILTLLPENRVGEIQRRASAVTEVVCYSTLWPTMIPQHGPGRKHHRSIRLTPWQEAIVRKHPSEFLRGCLESDGCRHRRIVNGRDYPAYAFTNHSLDILELVMWVCRLLGVGCRRTSRWNLSIARRPDVARLDRLFGWKRQLAFPFIAASAFHPR
jgi:hypothetical protein